MPNTVLVHLGGNDDCPRAKRLSGHLTLPVTVINETSRGSTIYVQPSGPYRKLLRAIWLLFGFFDRYLKDKFLLNLDATLKQDCKFIVHDLLILPAVASLVTTDRVVFDAREYYPKQFENSVWWKATAGRLAHYICSNYLHRVAAVTTVSNGLAKAYEQNYGITADVIYSLPQAYDGGVSDLGDPLQLVHHGNCSPVRGLENMIFAMDDLGTGYTLDLYLIKKEPDYFDYISRLAAARPNVQLCTPIPFNSIIDTLSRYDIGLFVPPPATFNLKHSMPNKLFEFVQANLMLVVSPLEDASKFVVDKRIGIATPGSDGKDIAKAISNLSRSDIMEFKSSSHEVAKGYNLEEFVQSFAQLLQKI